ncbi:MAG: hypothetical protein QM726_10195 [Chitinophagaceae bacterium]
MKQLIFAGRSFYAIALVVYGVQQCYFRTFRDVFFSPYQDKLPLLSALAIVFGLYLIATGILIFIPARAKKAALLLGAVFMGLLLGAQLTYELFSQPNKLYHLGLWTAPLKELALAGGAFVVAGSFETDPSSKKSFLEKLIPYGNLFFLITISSFGISHIIYADYIQDLVPAGMANHLFWVNVTGICLLAAGVSIILGIRIRPIALLLSVMIFLWVWLVHLPGTLSHPLAADRGNLLASTFDALAFSGTALLIALTMKKQQWIECIENWR